MTKNIDQHEVFWLARYAHNTLAPLYAEAQEFEPSLSFGIDLGFNHADAAFHRENNICAYAHWKREGMLHFTSGITDKAGVDAVAKVIQKFIDKERAAVIDALNATYTKAGATK